MRWGLDFNQKFNPFMHVKAMNCMLPHLGINFLTKALLQKYLKLECKSELGGWYVLGFGFLPNF